MSQSPKILTIRLKPSEQGTDVLVEFGITELTRTVSSGQGVVRMSAIFDGAGKLADVHAPGDDVDERRPLVRTQVETSTSVTRGFFPRASRAKSPPRASPTSSAMSSSSRATRP